MFKLFKMFKTFLTRQNMEDGNFGLLSLLPDVPLRVIASYLPLDDLIQFSKLKPSWAFLKPTLQHFNGFDFDIHGPSHDEKSSFECNCNCNCSCKDNCRRNNCSCRGNCNCGKCICTAEIYFEIPITTARLSSISMSWQWKDKKGWGNRKGQIWLKLFREGQEIADSRYTSFF